MSGPQIDVSGPIGDPGERVAGPGHRSRRLRTRVISPYGVLGGAELWLLRLMAATSRLDVAVTLLSDGPFRQALEERGVPVQVWPTGPRARDIAGLTARLVRDLRARPPEVVLANGVKAASAAVPAGRLSGIPVVWAKHDHSFDRWLARPLGSWADRVVAAAEEVAAPTGRPDAVIIPPPRPDRPPAGRHEARRFWAERGIDLRDGPNLAIVARLVPQKGVDIAIAALALPPAAEWRLAVVGPDDPAAPKERQRLLALAASLGLEERVVFAGEVPEVGHWLAGFDALAVLARTDRGRPNREGFGISAFEAMLAGVPVVGVEGGAVTRRLQGRAGISVPPNDPSAVAEALGRLLSAAARERAGRWGKKLVADHPTAVASASVLARVLSEVASRPGAGLSDGPPITVVTPVLNEGPALDRLLEPIVPQLGASDEILVVDAGSSDDTPARARRWGRRHPRIRTIVSRGASAGRGRNAGVDQARNEVIACSDAGCRPGTRWLTSIRTAFAEEDPPSLVCGVYRVVANGVFEEAVAVSAYPNPDEARRPSPLTRAYGRLFGRAFDPRRPDARSVAFTASAWRAAGGFPESVEAGEDLGFGRAIQASGGRCVLHTDAEVEWDERLSPTTTARRYYRYGLGDGHHGDGVSVGRNLLRVGAYIVGSLLMARGPRPGRIGVGAAALAYLSLPLSRAARRPKPLAVAALVPWALALRDLAKSAGCLHGLLRRARRCG